MRKTKELLIYGIVLIGLALIDIYTLALDFRAGLLEMFTTTDPEMQTAKTVLYVVTGYAVWTILLGLYLGIKGITESRNPSGGRLHIFLARLIGIINLVLAVILGLSLLDSTDFWHDFETFGLCVIDLIFMFSYASAAKAVRNGAD